MIYSYIKDSAFTELKRDANFYTRYVKGVPFEEGIRKMSLSCQILYIKGAWEGRRLFKWNFDNPRELRWPLASGDLLIRWLMRPSWKAARGVWVCLPLVKTSKPVVLHIEEEALWLLIFYYFTCTFLRPCGSFCDLSISVPFYLSYLSYLFQDHITWGNFLLREFSLKWVY